MGGGILVFISISGIGRLSKRKMLERSLLWLVEFLITQFRKLNKGLGASSISILPLIDRPLSYFASTS